MRVSQGGNLGRRETGHTIVMCVRQVLLLHTIAALFRRTFQFTNALNFFGTGFQKVRKLEKAAGLEWRNLLPPNPQCT